MTKTYTIYCITKANRHEYLHAVTVEAANVKEAKEAAYKRIMATSGRHAFRMTNGKPEPHLIRYFENYFTEPMAEILAKAAEPAGFDITYNRN